MAGCNCSIDHFDANTVDVFTLGEQNLAVHIVVLLAFHLKIVEQKSNHTLEYNIATKERCS
eukprot:15343925-Ditylum_brightwellii.AAC.2